MKRSWFVLSLAILLISMSTVGVVFADNAPINQTNSNIIERLGVKGPLEFNDTVFKLAWTDKANANYYAQEYLPDGEKLDSFNQMLAIHLFTKDLKPDDAVQQKIKELEKRKTMDPICNYAVFKSKDGKEFILDFLVGEIEDNRYTVVEFNTYRYQQVDLKNKKKALIVYTYCKRAYGDNIKSFLNTLKDTRMNHIKQMTSIEIPIITLEKSLK